MKTYRCNQCGHQLDRPTQPLKCPQCGRQAIGLFKLVGEGPASPSPGVPPAAPAGPPPAAASPPAGSPSRPAPPHGGVSPIASPPPPPGGATGPPRPKAAPPAQPSRPAPSPSLPAQPAKAAPSPAPPAQPPPLPPEGKPAERAGRRGGPSKAKPAAPAAGEAPRAAAPRPSAPAPPRPAPKPEPPQPKPRVRPTPVRPDRFLWAYPAEPPYSDEARPLRNAPAVDAAGRIYLAAQGRLCALSLEQGRPKLLWEYVLGSHVPGPVVLAADETLRVHAADGFLHAVTCDGKQVWPPVKVGEPLGWAAPVTGHDGSTWISAYDGGLIRVDAAGKTSARRYFRSRAKFDSAGIILGGVLYIGSEDGYVFAVRLEADHGENVWDHAADHGFTGGFVNSSPAVAPDGTLVVAARDALLFGFAAAGATVWKTSMPGQLLGSPVIDPQGHVYLGVSQARRGEVPRGMLVSIDGNSHKIRWQYGASGPVESTPVVGEDGVIYFGDNAGTIHAVDGRGSALWTASVGAAVRSAGTILAAEQLAFGVDDGTLVVLRCSSAALAQGGWPKIAGNPAQSGLASG